MRLLPGLAFQPATASSTVAWPVPLFGRDAIRISSGQQALAYVLAVRAGMRHAVVQGHVLRKHFRGGGRLRVEVQRGLALRRAVIVDEA